MTWEKTGGSGLWAEYENDETGEKSIKQHTLKVVKQWCPQGQHIYRVHNMGKRLAVCDKCGQEYTFIVGRDEIDGGLIKKTIS
jgi:hypothetical protein